MQFVLITRDDLTETNDCFRAACSARGIDLAEVQAGSVSGTKLSSDGPRALYRAAGDDGACLIEKLLARDHDAVLHDPHFPCDHHLARLARTYVPVPVPLPRTVFLPDPDPERVAAQANWLGGFPVVVKRMGHEGGAGVGLATDLADLMRQLGEAEAPPLLQRFIPHTHTWRLTVLGDRVLAATAYAPGPGDFRSNTAGAHLVHGQPVPDAAQEIAVTAVRALRLEFGGVDLMEDADGTLTLAEVNFPCFFAQHQGETGTDIAGAIVDYLVAKAG